MNDTVLSTLGLALRSGGLAVGETPVEEACRTRKAKLLLLASDAAENTVKKCRRASERCGVPLVLTPYDKSRIGSALGRSVCALAAVTDKGLAELIGRKLAAIESN